MVESCSFFRQNDVENETLCEERKRREGFQKMKEAIEVCTHIKTKCTNFLNSQKDTVVPPSPGIQKEIHKAKTKILRADKNIQDATNILHNQFQDLLDEERNRLFRR